MCTKLKPLSLTFTLVLAGLAAFAGGSSPAEDGLRLLHPAEGAVYPPNLAPPTWAWRASGESPWSVAVDLGDGAFLDVAVVAEAAYRPSADEWDSWKARIGRKSGIVLVRSADGQAHQASFRFSEHPLQGTLVFRLVRAPLGSDPLLRTQLRRQRAEDTGSAPLADALPLTPCKGCHALSNDGFRAAFQVRDPYDGPRLETFDLVAAAAHTPDLPTEAFGRSAGLTWTPDGRIVVAMNLRASEVRGDDGFALTHHASDLALVDPDSGHWALVAGASVAHAVEDFPAISPDGATLAFTRGEEISTDHGALDVYTVSLSGDSAGNATLLIGASANGLANYFPRYSPDGRWIAFVTSDGGYFARPSSELMLVPANGGEAISLTVNTPGRMDSWPTWSPDGHWLAWASRRDDPDLTRILLTEIDAQGRCTPPIPLPTDTPPIWSHNHPTFAPVAD